MVSGKGELPVRGGPAWPRHFHSFEREGAGLLQDFHHAEARQDANRFGAHVLRARLVAGKCGAIHQEN